MSRLRSHDLREAISNLMTVSMHLQDSLSRFHRPSLHKNRPSCPRGECVDSHPCVSRIPELLNYPCTEHNRSKRAVAHLVPWVSRCDSLASSTNQCHQLGLTRTQTSHVLFLGRRIHGIPCVFNRTLDPNCDSRVAAMIFDVSSPISIGHHHDRTLRISAGFPIKYLSKHLLFISSGVVAVPT